MSAGVSTLYTVLSTDKSTSTFVVLQDNPKKEKIISKFTKGRKMTFLCVKEECGKQEIAFIAQFTAFT